MPEDLMNLFFFSFFPDLQIKECVFNSMPAPTNPVSHYPLLFIDNGTS